MSGARLLMILLLATAAATTKASAAVALLAGKLEFAVGDNDTIRFTARGSGWSTPWGDVINAEATWSPSADKVMALLGGQIDELTINPGTFAVEFSGGDRIEGAIAGTVQPRDDGTFGLAVKFTATHGTGRFAGVTGSGRLHAVQELESREFRAMLNAKLSVPR